MNRIDQFINLSFKNSSTTNTNDWHRLLLTRLKPNVTGKYRTITKDVYKSDSIVCKLLEKKSLR